MKGVVVAGANGFIGRPLVKELVRNGIPTAVLVWRESEDSLGADLVREFELSNINELANAWDAPYGLYDTFINLAWQGSAGPERADTQLQLANAQWSLDVLRFAKTIGCTRYVGAGSIMEQEVLAASAKQGNRPGESYIYSVGKLAAHLMGKSVAASIGMDFIWVMITNVYGPGELSPRFINSTLRKIEAREPLEFTAATQLYDFVYVDDAARAFRLISERGTAFHDYLVGSGHPRQLRQYIQEITDTFPNSPVVEFGTLPFTGVDLPEEQFSMVQTFRDTGFAASTTFRAGLEQTMAWLRLRLS